MKEIVSLFVVLLLATSSALSAEERETAGFKYYREFVTTVVPFDVGFFTKDIKDVEITGVLFTPFDNEKKLRPLVIFSHGSQDGGVEQSFDGLMPPIKDYLMKGYAFLLPIRKGFNVKGRPPSEVRVASSEPISCNNYSASIAGLKSAILDTRAVLKALEGRTDLDLTKITVMGQSRGGFLSLALAAEGLPGITEVINFSGGWYSERCYADFNRTLFGEFGKKIKVPIISFYGTADSYYSVYHIEGNLRALEGSGLATSHIFPGAPHSFYRKVGLWQEFVFGAK